MGLHSEVENLRLLVDNTEDPLWLVDNSCTIVVCNSAFRKWVTHFIGQELNKGDNVLFNGQNKAYQDKFEMCYKLALSGRAFRSVEDMVIDGTIHYTGVSFNPVYDAANNLVGVSCFARDITEQRSHLFRIEQQNVALREIAFIESHKIRGPVATILGLEQLYNYYDYSDPINIEIIEGIRKVSLDLDQITREVVRKSNEIGS